MSTSAALNEDQLESLALFLEDQAEEVEGLDFFALHGLLTANVVSPKPMAWADLETIIFPEEPNWKGQQKTEILDLIKVLQKEITEQVESGQSFPVPCELNVEGDEDGEAAPLENWAMGFMILTIEQNDGWYGKFENDAAELLFPISYASGLDEDNEDFAAIDDDHKMSLQVCASIPDNVIDLFLTYHGEQK